jgi:hypothetical protein
MQGHEARTDRKINRRLETSCQVARSAAKAAHIPELIMSLPRNTSARIILATVVAAMAAGLCGALGWQLYTPSDLSRGPERIPALADADKPAPAATHRVPEQTTDLQAAFQPPDDPPKAVQVTQKKAQEPRKDAAARPKRRMSSAPKRCASRSAAVGIPCRTHRRAERAGAWLEARTAPPQSFAQVDDRFAP